MALPDLPLDDDGAARTAPRAASPAAVTVAGSDGRVASSTSADVCEPDAIHWLSVALDVPLPGLFDYRADRPVAIGTRVIVRFGPRRMVGVVADTPAAPSYPPAQVRAIDAVLDDMPPLSADWMKLARFAADYYQRPLGEVILPALPGALRKPAAYEGARSAGGPIARIDARAAKRKRKAKDEAPILAAPTLNAAQQHAVDTLAAAKGFETFVLFGVTGSGKTEVYLRAAEAVLRSDRQVLLLVPEINLTPQLEGVLTRRLEQAVGVGAVAVLHSGLADGERLEAWLRAVRGQARLIVGTRLALFVPLPALGLIVVDEEHDPSYKQQDGLRYSARDLAIWRARDRNIPIVLGSATPSLETWHHAESGRYVKLSLPQRASEAEPPTVSLIDTRRLKLEQGLSPQLVAAIEDRLARGEQSLIFLNRRGYAPVLNCEACGWMSTCKRCSAFMVLHRGIRSGHMLRCHHCGAHERVPTACPDCGNQDLQPMGRGTQRLEEYLAVRFPNARLARIDADSTRRKGSAEALFAQVHANEVDILVGTQMVAKGHDFHNLGFVGVLNADAMLFSHDFRAPERLFSQLMQVAGRAGRRGSGADVYIQTGYPEQPVYQALVRHDYAGFAAYALDERRSAGLPPFAFQALLTAESRELATAVTFLSEARDLPTARSDLPGAEQVMVYDPVPLRVVKVADQERAQLLVESDSRPALQAFLRAWAPCLADLPGAARVRWQLEVDPLEI